MDKYRLSNEARIDLIRIHHYGVKKFGMVQADKYIDSLFESSFINSIEVGTTKGLKYMNS